MYKVSIDAEQQKVTVSGSVDAATLINKLTKSGKHAQLWSQNINQTHNQNQINKQNNKIQHHKQKQNNMINMNNGSVEIHDYMDDDEQESEFRVLKERANKFNLNLIRRRRQQQQQQNSNKNLGIKGNSSCGVIDQRTLQSIKMNNTSSYPMYSVHKNDQGLRRKEKWQPIPIIKDGSQKSLSAQERLSEIEIPETKMGINHENRDQTRNDMNPFMNMSGNFIHGGPNFIGFKGLKVVPNNGLCPTTMHHHHQHPTSSLINMNNHHPSTSMMMNMQNRMMGMSHNHYHHPYIHPANNYNIGPCIAYMDHPNYTTSESSASHMFIDDSDNRSCSIM